MPEAVTPVIALHHTLVEFVRANAHDALVSAMKLSQIGQTKLWKPPTSEFRCFLWEM